MGRQNWAFSCNLNLLIYNQLTKKKNLFFSLCSSLLILLPVGINFFCSVSIDAVKPPLPPCSALLLSLAQLQQGDPRHVLRCRDKYNTPAAESFTTALSEELPKHYDRQQLLLGETCGASRRFPQSITGLPFLPSFFGFVLTQSLLFFPHRNPSC